MAIVRVQVRRAQEAIDIYESEVPDGLTDEEVREFVEQAYYAGELGEPVDTSDYDDSDEEILLDTIERVTEGDEPL